MDSAESVDVLVVPLVNSSSDQYVVTLEAAPDAGVQLTVTAPFPAVQTGALI